jgi:hypothetical protein
MKTLSSFLLIIVVLGIQVACATPLDNRTAQTTTIVAASRTLTIPHSTQMQPSRTATAMHTLTPTSTPTSVCQGTPTLTIREGYDAIAQMAQNNGGCSLPCFLGIKPGQTTWREASDLFNYLGKKEPEPFKYPSYGINTYSYGFTREGNDESYIVTLDVTKNGELSLISAGMPMIQSQYSPRAVVTALGVPTQVVIEIGGIGANGPGRINTFDLKLYYETSKQWLLFSYEGIALQYKEDLVFCPTNLRQGINTDRINDGVSVLIQHGDLSIDDIEKIGVGGGSPLSGMTLESASGVDLNTFFSDMTGNKSVVCYTTPMTLWGG